MLRNSVFIKIFSILLIVTLVATLVSLLMKNQSGGSFVNVRLEDWSTSDGGSATTDSQVTGESVTDPADPVLLKTENDGVWEVTNNQRLSYSCFCTWNGLVPGAEYKLDYEYVRNILYMENVEYGVSYFQNGTWSVASANTAGSLILTADSSGAITVRCATALPSGMSFDINGFKNVVKGAYDLTLQEVDA